MSDSIIGITIAQVALLAGITFVDFQRRVIHPGLLIALAGISLFGILTNNHPAAQSAGVGALTAGLAFSLVYLGGKLFGKRRAVPAGAVVFGRGDVWLGAVCGLAVGFPGALLVALLALCLGGLSAGIYLAFTSWRGNAYQPFTVLPYAHNLAGATCLALLFPTQVAQVFAAM
ncbi:MAG: prepilin peptidase [Chloroflexi bacterium]|nr:prepilin peptidase [Chloroflexota bacterium]MCY3583799.1 prepilin peptidase [Chloroflexota bacterium]MCY3716269.1 prepilin peptidase [Chloroflexota bacterium]MDE2650402.1 prepilin peptidase [Chloroflexota bacterium]MYC55552.1 hypothetical protein [Chloroflexota bacterium]